MVDFLYAMLHAGANGMSGLGLAMSILAWADSARPSMLEGQRQDVPVSGFYRLNGILCDPRIDAGREVLFQKGLVRTSHSFKTSKCLKHIYCQVCFVVNI